MRGEKFKKTFDGRYCYFLHLHEGNPYTVCGTCDADDHWQALEKFRQGIGTSSLEKGKRYTIVRDAGKKGMLFCMEFVY